MDIIDLIMVNRLSKSNDVSASVPEFFSASVAWARRFYLNLNPSGKSPLAVVCGGMEECAPDYAIHRETFPFYSFEYVARGSGAVTLNQRKLLLRPGRLFSYGPGIPHHITSDPNNPLVKYFVDFSGTQALGLLRSCKLAPGTFGDVFPANVLQPLFDELIRIGLRGGTVAPVLCAKLLECLALRITGVGTPFKAAESHAFLTYQNCRQYIERHCRRARSLEQIARECHINKAYLCRLFRLFDHQSPYQYLLKLKMQYAAERMEDPNVLVKQAAEEVGFADPFHFSRIFRSVFGLSPGKFRGLR